MKLIGYAFSTGRIDFTREDNPWAFSRIDSGMKQSQKDRIRVDPAQAPIELRSAPINGDVEPVWMKQMEAVLKSSDSIYLQYKSGLLRFRRANHEAGKNKTFVTLGNQDEVDLFASEHWQRIRYLYAHRRNGFCFDVATLITHKSTSDQETRRIELGTRLDMTHDSGVPQLSFDATGSGASVDIIEWRGKVREGETGRYAPEDCHLEVDVRNVIRPFSFLHEDRAEFSNHSYTFGSEKVNNQFQRLIRRRLHELESRPEDSVSDL